MLTDSLLGLGTGPAVFLATEAGAAAVAAAMAAAVALDAAGDFLFAVGLPALPVLAADGGLRRGARLCGLRPALSPGICFAGGDLVTLAIRWALRCCAE